jgi:ubiquinone/menaquinone biosynthesis C-methylase UbiE
MASSSGNVFDAMGSVWAEIADKNQTLQQIQFMKSNLKPNGCILDLACGTGRHSIPLSVEGYCMVGLDVSGRLLRIAKQRSASAQLVRGDLRFLPFRDESFSAAVSMDTSLGYLQTENEDAESLVEAKRVIKRDGVLIVDVFNRAHLVAKYRGKQYPPKTFDYFSFTLQQKRTVSNRGDWLFDVWSVKSKADGQVKVFRHRVRLYQAHQLRDLLETVGFRIVATWGDYEEQEFSGDSPRLIVVAAVN